MSAIVHRHLGTRWVAGVSDCWSMARRIWAEDFGWSVPPLPCDPAAALAARRAFADARLYAGWCRVECPREGAAVIMARAGRPCHIGVWIAGGVLHAVEGVGTIWTPPDRLPDLGWRICGYWLPEGAVRA